MENQVDHILMQNQSNQQIDELICFFKNEFLRSVWLPVCGRQQVSSNCTSANLIWQQQLTVKFDLV